MTAAAAEGCRARLARIRRCSHKKLDELNRRLVQQSAERQLLDRQRESCFQQLQHESCVIRNRLQARPVNASVCLDLYHNNNSNNISSNQKVKITATLSARNAAMAPNNVQKLKKTLKT